MSIRYWSAALGLLCAAVSTFAAPAASMTGKDGAKMVLVPAGPFLMGSAEKNADETPPHEVNIPAFYIDVTEVTVGQYAAYVKATGAKPPVNWPNGQPGEAVDRPVTNVTWLDAMSYAQWAGKRLPTEAEWEKAARGTDGRRFPWGDEPCTDCANLDSDKRQAVGKFPRSVSPFGALDMAGNVWEWTADWYDPYPGTNARSIHFGRKYKVMRGGGASYFYSLNENTGRCALRGRILPYAGEDFLGFRCAQDVDAAHVAYNAATVLAEARDLVKGTLPPGATLSYETEYADQLKARSFPVEIAGPAGSTGSVRGGVPFPEGLVKDIHSIQVLGPDGKARPTQQKVLTPWKDGSARWVLLDFPASAGEKLAVSIGGTAASAAAGVKVSEQGGRIAIDSGAAVFTFSKEKLIEGIAVGGTPVVAGSRLDLVLENGALLPMPAESIKWEDKGPLHATLRLTGWFADKAGAKMPIQYDLRAHVVAGATRVNLLLTLSHLQPRTGKTEDRTPMLKIVDASWHFLSPAPLQQAAFGGDLGVTTAPVKTLTELVQPDAIHYLIVRDGKQVGQGTKAQGWVAVQTGGGWLSVGVRHFWQNFAKALQVNPKETVVRLWAGKEPLEFEATIAKTHELVLEFSKEAPSGQHHVRLDPLRLTTSPAWACGTQALGGPMVPRIQETISHMPYWELARENGMRKWMRAMMYSWRDFGDTRHGGDAKGANASHNLEYDVPFNFLVQHMATGESWYLDAAEVQCRHQGDIDTDNVTGHPYKHMIMHTTWYADIAHMFLRGLVVHYWLTGEERSLETARRIGDHIAPLAENFREFGNERQIGWGLYALTGIYEATLDEKYLHAANTLCNKLVTEMSPNGKFNIRWDNRMSLMNGMAMNGMMSVQEMSGSKQLADGLLRLTNRTLGFYPEYAMRTLHGYAWALTYTKDPRFLDVLARTWESCLELMVGGADAVDAEVHAWRFPWFVVKYGLYPVFEKAPALLPDAASWKGRWLPGPDLELYVKTTGQGPAPIMLILHGLVTGRVEVFNIKGEQINVVDVPVGRLYTPAVVSLPPAAGAYRLRVSSPGGSGWELHYDARSIVTLYDPKAQRLSDLYPQAFTYLRPGVKEIKVVFEAQGEGSHKITLYDPAGNIVGAAEKFVDFEDKGRYEVELKLAVNPGVDQIWSLEAYNARVLSIDGFLPYWATIESELFNPEAVHRAARPAAPRNQAATRR